ncbi:class I SAM-dependent methyltransferase [Candidatus Azambacteria bacterium]|nr:class I SAM-dependent methyltransferase [Candidatus Azambacteria bacterium]
MSEELTKINNSGDREKRWGETVGSYFEAADITNEEINFPAIVRGIGDIEGQTILDYGCGNGRFSRKIELMKAKRVIGVDREQSMIDLARKSNPDSQIEYHVNLEGTMAFLEDNSVDKVMANLVFMMSPTKEDMSQAFREVQRVLKENGIFVYLVTHSAFIEKGAPDYRNQFDEPFDYFAEEKPYRFILLDSQGKEINEKFYDYHYTLATYLNMAIQSGFTIVGVEEVGYNDSNVAERHKISQEFQKFPQSFMVVSKKLNASK